MREHYLSNCEKNFIQKSILEGHVSIYKHDYFKLYCVLIRVSQKRVMGLIFDAQNLLHEGEVAEVSGF